MPPMPPPPAPVTSGHLLRRRLRDLDEDGSRFRRPRPPPRALLLFALRLLPSDSEDGRLPLALSRDFLGLLEAEPSEDPLGRFFSLPFAFLLSSALRGGPPRFRSSRSSSSLRASSSRFRRSSSRRASTISSFRFNSAVSFSLSCVLLANSDCKFSANLSTSESRASVKLCSTSSFNCASSFRSRSTSVIPLSAAAAKSRATMPLSLSFRAVMSFWVGHGYEDKTCELASAIVFKNVLFNRSDRRVFSNTYTPQSFKFSCW
mmetsp:Transcript_42978/g.119546  ORF Transcript_42978/g.119546 Transcript_42978/m.119546 type:complete len:261 (-) Transcript_42978:462-1244(-)